MNAAVVDVTGNVAGQAESPIDRTRPPRDLLREDVARVVLDAMTVAGVERRAVRGVGMGLPGNIDRRRGVCRFSPNFRWHDVEVARPLEEALDLSVFLLNDVRSHTLGEMQFGAGRGVRSLAMLALGTGIGGGLVVNGRLIEGAHSAGGELGHITVDPLGPRCGCGNRGCVEALASGPAIVRAVAELAEVGGATGILALAGSLEAVTPAHVTQAARDGDVDALSILSEAGRWLGVAIATVLTAIDPERVLIGGGVGQAGELLLVPARREVARRCRMIRASETPIVAAQLGQEAGVLGAAALALESVGLLPGLLDASHTA